MAVSPDGTRAYVTNTASNSVSVIDTATNTVIATIGVGTDPPQVTVSPDGTRAYVTNTGSSTVSVINTDHQHRRSPPSGVGYRPTAGGGQPRRHPRLRHQRPASNTVSVINTDHQHRHRHHPRRRTDPGRGGGQPRRHPRLRHQRNSNGTVSVIDTTTNTVTATIRVGRSPTEVAVSPDGTRAYVTNTGSSTVSVIDTTTNTVIATIRVGERPTQVAVSPDGTLAYVTNTDSNTVSVIDTTTNTRDRHHPRRPEAHPGVGQPRRHPRLRHQHRQQHGVGDRHQPPTP